MGRVVVAAGLSMIVLCLGEKIAKKFFFVGCGYLWILSVASVCIDACR